MGMSDAGVGFKKRNGIFKAGIRPSLLIAILVFFIHLLVVVLLLNDRGVKPSSASELILQVRLLSPDKRKSVSPSIDSDIPLQPAAITIKNLELPAIAIEDITSKPAIAELSLQHESTIFDPRLRKKLSDIGSRVAPQPTPELKHWTDSSGVQIVEVKQGECIRAMPGDANARGDNWSLSFKCGKSEGEQMIDSINADMAERNRRRHNK